VHLADSPVCAFTAAALTLCASDAATLSFHSVQVLTDHVGHQLAAQGSVCDLQDAEYILSR
jgi:hypothetical protein